MVVPLMFTDVHPMVRGTRAKWRVVLAARLRGQGGGRMQQPSAFHLLAKPTGASCNLDCKYCFFLSKDRLYGGGSLRMEDDVLDAYIQQLLAAQPNSEVNLAWQG